ncbi:MAG: alcohol dehydrogenase catalytic domain-containing protein, partial [Planctomycetes bacterium]|nr:alcohol dehydrogenase catalytic domain-containing protein [Planctomycetota bacterium]
MYTRAVLNEIKTEFLMKQEALPELKAHEVVVELAAAALNRRDYWITQGMYPGLQLPCTPGSDGAGTIMSLGSDVQDLSIGDEVIMNPGMNWGDQQSAQDVSFEVLGMPSSGTHATHITIAADRIHAKPQHLDWQQAAALPLAYATAYRAVFSQAQVQAGQRVLVTGIGGGVALAALQLAHAYGCEVIVTTSDEEKGQSALELGAVAFYNYHDEDWAQQA